MYRTARQTKPVKTPRISGLVTIFLSTETGLIFLPSSFTKSVSAIIASILKSGIETEERIEAATTGFVSPEEIVMARDIPIIA